ncbi:Protein AEXR-1, partial [Aphelenchoides avenae]
MYEAHLTGVLYAIKNASDDNCTSPESFHVFQAVVESSQIILSPFAVVLNCAVAVCAVTLLRRSGDTMHVFVTAMAVGDILVTALGHPYILAVRRQVLPGQIIACSTSHFVELLGISLSGLSLTFITADKFIYFRWPLKYLLMSQKCAMVISLGGTAISLGFVSCLWIFRVVHVDETYTCAMKTSESKLAVYQVYVILFCVAPMISSILLSIYLFRLVRRRRAQGSDADLAITRDLPSVRIKMQSMLFIFATTAWTAFSLLPHAMYWLLVHYFFAFSSLSCREKQTQYQISWTFLYLLYLNP